MLDNFQIAAGKRETIDHREVNASSLLLFETADQTSTPGEPSTQPSAGALGVSIGYFDMGSADGTVLYVVFNASDATDAASKLSAAGTRHVIKLGERRTWSFPITRCTRIDYASNTAAETGDSLVVGECVL